MTIRNIYLSFITQCGQFLGQDDIYNDKKRMKISFLTCKSTKIILSSI